MSLDYILLNELTTIGDFIHCSAYAHVNESVQSKITKAIEKNAFPSFQWLITGELYRTDTRNPLNLVRIGLGTTHATTLDREHFFHALHTFPTDAAIPLSRGGRVMRSNPQIDREDHALEGKGYEMRTRTVLDQRNRSFRYLNLGQTGVRRRCSYGGAHAPRIRCPHCSEYGRKSANASI